MFRSLLVITTVVVSLARPVEAAAERSPNIIFTLVDDND
jgi:hypothetical protein